MVHRYKLIPWNKRIYKGVEITIFANHPNERVALIAEENLQSELFNEQNKEWINEEAQALDSTITFYVPEWRITLPSEELASWVETAMTWFGRT